MLLRHTAFQLMGRGASLVAGLIGIPLYLSYLGLEAYGIVGVFISLMSLSGLFDLGLPMSVNRQISVMRTDRSSLCDISALVRSFELIILLLAGLIFIMLYSLSSFIAKSWLNLVSLDADMVMGALELASIAIVLRFPIAMYNSCLYAFDYHGRSNIVTTFAAVFRVLAAVVAFEFYEVSLSVFFWSQIVVNGVELLSLVLILWTSKLEFFVAPMRGEVLKKALKMTFSLTGISITALLLSQVDKIILSKFIALDEFGVYTVAYSLAMGVLPIAYSIGNASFPSISRFLAAGQLDEFQRIIRKILTLKSILVVPISGVLIFYSDRLLELFVLFTPKADKILDILPLLAIGGLLQCFTVLFHGVRIAQGKPEGLLAINLIALVLFSGLYFWAGQMYGLLGACLVFISFNLFLLLAQAVLSLRETLYRPLWLKELGCMVLPLSISFGLLFAFSWIEGGTNLFEDLFLITASLLVIIFIQMFRLKVRNGSWLP